MNEEYDLGNTNVIAFTVWKQDNLVEHQYTILNWV